MFIYWINIWKVEHNHCHNIMMKWSEKTSFWSLSILGKNMHFYIWYQQQNKKPKYFTHFIEINRKQPFHHLLKHCLIQHWFKITEKKVKGDLEQRAFYLKQLLILILSGLWLYIKIGYVIVKSHQQFIFCLPCFVVLC